MSIRSWVVNGLLQKWIYKEKKIIIVYFYSFRLWCRLFNLKNSFSLSYLLSSFYLFLLFFWLSNFCLLVYEYRCLFSSFLFQLITGKLWRDRYSYVLCNHGLSSSYKTKVRKVRSGSSLSPLVTFSSCDNVITYLTWQSTINLN